MVCVLSPHINPMGRRPDKSRPIVKNTIATKNEYNELNTKESGHVNGLASNLRIYMSSKDLPCQGGGQTQGTHETQCEIPLTELSAGSQVRTDKEGEITEPKLPPEGETENNEENPFLERYSEESTTETDTQGETRDMENTRKNNITRVKRKQGITITSWNTRGKNDKNHLTKWKKI